jgi:hypothetical protein
MGFRDEAAKRAAEVALDKLIKSLDFLRKEWKAASPTVRKTLEKNAAKLKIEIEKKQKQYELNLKEMNPGRNISTKSESTVGKSVQVNQGRGITSKGSSYKDKLSNATTRYNSLQNQYKKLSDSAKKAKTAVQKDAYTKQLEKVKSLGVQARKELDDLRKNPPKGMK